ncbi:MAG: phage head closure protein [Alphaproteobacteria bacterium]
MIGDLRHRVTFKTPVATLDDGGGQSIAWADGPGVWARIVSLGGAEVVRASEIVPRGTYRLTIRYRNDLTPAMRIQFGAKLFEIDAIYDPEGKGALLFVDCHDASTP